MKPLNLPSTEFIVRACLAFRPPSQRFSADLSMIQPTPREGRVFPFGRSRTPWLRLVLLLCAFLLGGQWGMGQGTPPATSSLCSPSVPAAISGSTGEQGVLDPTNTIAPDQPEGGLVWPSSAAAANIFLDTGVVVFTDSVGAAVGGATTTLPGVAGAFPFPAGRLNFTRVHLTAGKTVRIVANAAAPEFASFGGVAPPALVLSCGDVIIEATSILTVGTAVNTGVAGTPVVFRGRRYPQSQ